jgi:hypothetical protein
MKSSLDTAIKLHQHGRTEEAGIREFSVPVVAMLDARLWPCRWQGPGSGPAGGRAEVREEGAGALRKAIGGGQRVRPSLVSTVPLWPWCATGRASHTSLPVNTDLVIIQVAEAGIL